ncbi:MAG: urea ABC transporter permease subunit UrtB [Oceanospirillales bacterium]|nr:urea ABC transporter permease subunit UrtB [Oceanospirillales bacterium]
MLGCWLGLLLVTPVVQAANAPLPPTLEPLLEALVDAKLSQAAPVLTRLEAEGGEAILPLFRTMLAGDLYYIKASKRVIAVTEAAGEEAQLDLLSGTPINRLSKREISKIRVNNSLRGQLRDAISRLQLGSASASVREAAVRALLSDLDPGTLDAIRAARLNEGSADVRDVMDMALALNRLNTATEAADRIEAIAQLEGSLEGPVRNVLNRIADSDPAPQVQQAAQKALVGIEQRVEFYAFIDQLFFGLSLGSVLLLAAIGLAITFGVMGVINMAHGEMIMLGAYTTYVVQLLMPNHIDYSLWVAIPMAFIVAGLAGVLLERLVIRHLHGRPLETLLATFGVSLVLQQLVRTVFSPLNRQVASPEWMSGSWEINPVLSLTLNRLYILAFALLVFFALMLLLKKSSLGLNVRAVSQNRDMARSMGIRTGWVDAMTFGLGSGIAGIAGVALSQLTNVGPNLGQAYIIDSFMVVVFGGVGNLWGTLVAAFSLGIANKFLEPVTGAVLASILVLVFIILFIQKRPKGLFPQKGRAAE